MYIKTILFIFAILFINVASAQNLNDSCILCHGYVPTIPEVIMPIIQPEEVVVQPVFEPARLWTYTSECSKLDFIGVCNPGDYIIPNNPIIKYYADRMFISDKGVLEWKEVTDISGIRYGGGVGFNYLNDIEQWKKEDFWVNPDYLLTHQPIGDCEDLSVAMASLLEAKKIPTAIIGAYLTNNDITFRDWYVEYKLNGTYYVSITGLGQGLTFKRDDMKIQEYAFNIKVKPILMFRKGGYYTTYQKDW